VKRITAYVTDELDDRVRYRMYADRVTMTALVTAALEAYLSPAGVSRRRLPQRP
jgi:hypothetical protein